MSGDPDTIREARQAQEDERRRERVRRAAEDGERLYQIRMHAPDGPTIKDDFRIDGILTLDLVDALRFVDNLAKRLAAMTAQRDELARALATADREASIAHDAIWHESVQGVGGTGIDILHSNDREDSAQSALWRLHEVARAALAAAGDAE